MLMLDPQRISVAAAGPCEHVAERTHAWVDGELSDAAAAELRAHVAGCPSCARAAAVEVRFLEAIRPRARVERAPATLRERVRDHLRAVRGAGG